MKQSRLMRGVLPACVAGLTACACSKEQLSRQIPIVKITPVPRGNQRALDEPPGIELGAVPLSGSAWAEFKVENPSNTPLEVRGAHIRDAIDAAVTILARPERVAPHGEAPLRVSFEPTGEGRRGHATAVLETNAGHQGDTQAEARVQGTGTFLGAPNLEICYLGTCHRLPEDCQSSTEDDGACLLPPLDFGNVALSTLATQPLRLRNLPAAGTCQLSGDAAPCTVACVLTIAPDPLDLGPGLGFVPAQAGFRVVGNVVVPFKLAPPDPACDASDGILRAELRLLLAFQAPATPGDEVQASLVVASDDPDAPRIEIPVKATPREAPVAVARLRECSTDPAPCADEEQLAPLGRAVLDGSGSYDPQRPDQPEAITDWQWQVIETPSGVDPAILRPEGNGTPLFSFFLPLAGSYTVRLTVANEAGVHSGVGSASDVTFRAVPDSQLHVQLVWDHSANDQDIHLVHADQADRVYHQESDCYWSNCRPTCAEELKCPRWFAEDEVRQGANPRLDIDDQEGLGPENINIDSPRPGDYWVYVHYYGLISPVDEATRVTVRVYVDGDFRAEFRRTLNKHDLWRVAKISWHEVGAALLESAPSDGQGVGAVRTLQGAPGVPDGVDFSTLAP